ncbi:MAG: phosphatase PAP2 family protein [Pirellulales bacterium]
MRTRKRRTTTTAADGGGPAAPSPKRTSEGRPGFVARLGVPWFLALGAFAALALAIDADGPLPIDRAILNPIPRLGGVFGATPVDAASGVLGLVRRGDYLGALLAIVSSVGDSPAGALALLVPVLAFLYWAGYRSASIALGLADVTSAVANFSLKGAIGRPRPAPNDDWVQVPQSEFAFPSGHTVHYTVLFGFLALWAWKCMQPGWKRHAVVAVCLSMLVLVGPSRLYLAAHWPTDVVGGYLLGYVWLGAWVALIPSVWQRHDTARSSA